jgi:hypothetical protein
MTTLNEQMKALKQQMKEKSMVEALRHANMKARIAREYAEQLEALIRGEEPILENNDEAIDLMIEGVAELVTEEVAIAEEIKEIIPDECLAEIVAAEPEGIVSIVTPELERKVEKVEPVANLKNEVVKFLMTKFVKTETNINFSVAEFYGLFGIDCGKNTFTKTLKELGIWHYKSDGVIKYKYAWQDVNRVILPLWTEPEPEIISEPVIEAEEQTSENNLFLAMEEMAEVVELKSSRKNGKITKALDEQV